MLTPKTLPGQLELPVGPLTAAFLRQQLAPFDQRCPLCRSPLRALDNPYGARISGCEHADGLTLLAGSPEGVTG